MIVAAPLAMSGTILLCLAEVWWQGCSGVRLAHRWSAAQSKLHHKLGSVTHVRLRWYKIGVMPANLAGWQVSHADGCRDSVCR